MDKKLQRETLEAVIDEMTEEKDLGSLNRLITHHIRQESGDPYNPYYLVKLSDAYLASNVSEIANLYTNRALRAYPDLPIGGSSTHQMSLRSLVDHKSDPRQRVAFLLELIERFPTKVDLSASYLLLGEIYEKAGMWEEATKSQEKYLAVQRPKGVNTTYLKIRKKVRFHRSNKKWVVRDLDTLISKVKGAISTRNRRTLERYRAENFFAMGWTQNDEEDLFTHVSFDLGALLGFSMHYAKELDPQSGEDEVYLKTWGWANNRNLTVWYLCFRRIDYPRDPNINGSWEWAGVYFGEKL